MLCVYSLDNQVVSEHVLAYEREYFVDTAKSRTETVTVVKQKR